MDHYRRLGDSGPQPLTSSGWVLPIGIVLQPARSHRDLDRGPGPARYGRAAGPSGGFARAVRSGRGWPSQGRPQAGRMVRERPGRGSRNGGGDDRDLIPISVCSKTCSDGSCGAGSAACGRWYCRRSRVRRSRARPPAVTHRGQPRVASPRWCKGSAAFARERLHRCAGSGVLLPAAALAVNRWPTKLWPKISVLYPVRAGWCDRSGLFGRTRFAVEPTL